MRGHIKIHGPFPPPTGLLGPYARTTESFVYQIFDQKGRKLMGGSHGASDKATLITRTKRFAAEKGLVDPTIEFITPNEAK